MNAIAWPERLDPAAGYHLAPAHVAGAALPRWRDLPEASRRRASFTAALHFFSMNIHGERRLIAQARTRLATIRPGPRRTGLERLVADEERHSAWFTAFCCRYGDGPCRDLLVEVGAPGVADALDETLFFARVYLFESVVDAVNRDSSDDPAVVEPARSIHRLHHRDERGHLALGRGCLRDAVGALAGAERPRLAALLEPWCAAIARSLCPPEVFLAAGLASDLRGALVLRQAAAQRPIAALVAARRELRELGLPLAEAA